MASALLMLALLLTTVALALGADAPPAELPAYAIGESWALTDATYRLDRMQKDAYVFVAEGNREIWLGRDLGLRYVRRGSESFEVEPPPGLPALDDVVQFGRIQSPRYRLRAYQTLAALAIAASVVERRGVELAAVFARQSGKDELLAQLCAWLL